MKRQENWFLARRVYVCVSLCVCVECVCAKNSVCQIERVDRFERKFWCM